MTNKPTDMRHLFAADTHQLLLMRIEVALVRVQARKGIIPASAAERIAESATLECVSLTAVEAARVRVGHPMVALLSVWNAALPDKSGEWLHFGATTQDIEDTALIMEARSAAALMRVRLKRIEQLLLDLAERYAATPMIGRTVGRHALPITFGLKVSRWAAENRRGIERIELWRKRHCMGMLSGAVGSYASMGPDAFTLEEAFLAELDLGEPWAADWKGSKDMFAEFGAALSILATTWRKIAQEVFLLQGDDFDELIEQSEMVGSSTMPHKRNPRHCRRVMTLARTIPRHSEILLDWMVSIFERDQMSNASSVADICIAFEDMLKAVEDMLVALEVQPDNMKRNLLRSGGLIMAEHAMFLLSGAVGKQTAHALVRQAALVAAKEGVSLVAAIGGIPELRQPGTKIDWAKELDPEKYLGLSIEATKRTVASLRQENA
jgi:adenylosuccinate lyase